MTDLPEQTLHIWDLALLELYKAGLSARVNEGLPLGASETARQARRSMRLLREALRDTAWLPEVDAKRSIQKLKEDLKTTAHLLNDGIERLEVDEAHGRAIDAFLQALDEYPPEAHLIEIDQAFSDSTGDRSATLDSVKEELFAISSRHSRAPQSWWISVWKGTLPARTATPPQFSLYLDPGDASIDDIREVLAALNALHESAGGSGFIFRVEGDRLIMSSVHS